MFDRTKLISAAKGTSSSLVGWSHSYHPFYDRLSTKLKTSTSGYTVNSLAGVTMNVLEHTMNPSVKNIPLITNEYYEIFDNSGGADFSNVGAANNNIGTVFMATGATPTSWGTGELKLVSANKFLEDVFEEELTKLVSDFVHHTKNKLNTKEILSNQDIVKNNVVAHNEYAPNDGMFVGLLINPSLSDNLKMTINYIGLQLKADQTLTIYLYETTQKTAIKTFSLVYASSPSLWWKYVGDLTESILSGIMSVRADQGGKGNQYLLGYFQDDLDPDNYGLQGYFDKSSFYSPYRVYSKYVGIAPVRIPSAYLNGTDLPDNDVLDQFISENLDGLYIRFNMSCDITNVLIDNLNVFAKPLQYAIAIRILESAARSGSDMVHNPTKDSMSKEWEKYANIYRGQLYGGYDPQGNYHRGVIDELSVDFSGLDTICLKPRDISPTAHPLINRQYYE